MSDIFTYECLLVLVIITYSHLGYTQQACLKSTVNEYMSEVQVINLIKVSKGIHTLVFSQESCGISGCEYFVFSEVTPDCKVVSFNKRGFLIPNSFHGLFFKISSDKVITTYKYSYINNRFEWLK